MSDTPDLEKLYSLFLASNGVATDTRNIQKGQIFFALKGENFNGNEYAIEALQQGASLVVVDEITDDDLEDKFPDRVFKVENALITLQKLSAYHRSRLKCPVLAITGSNGKTTTKELVAAVLSKKFKTYYTKGNLNNQIGIPLTLLSVKTDAEFVIIEMGANHQGEIASYCEYVRPDYGLITNVGHAHTEGFGGFEGVVKGKTELYRYVVSHDGKLFVNMDNDVIVKNVTDTDSIIGYGKSLNYFCTGSPVMQGEFLSVNTGDTLILTHLIGEYNFENVLSAVCIGRYFGVDKEKIKEAIEAYVPSNNRSQKLTLSSNTIILDAYNANPSSMEEALKNFSKIEAANKVVILGQMMELGDSSRTQHERIKDLVISINPNQKIFVGEGFSFLKNESNLQWFDSTENLKKWFKSAGIESSLILIKGSRKNQLEKILED